MVITPIEQLIFVEILKISSNLMSQYSTMQDRLLYLVFIPHILLIIFIWIFADNVARIGGGIHTGIRGLVAISAYVFIIFGGWYGSWIAPVFVGLWQLVLAIALISFIASRFIHPARAKEMMAFGKVIGMKATEKNKIRKRLEREKESTERMIREISRTTPRTAEGRQYQEMQLIRLRAKVAEIEHELEDL